MAKSAHFSEVLIIGAGLAGLYAALRFAPQPVTVLSPCPLGDGASSAWAQGGIAAALDDQDSAAAHAQDSIIAGDGIVLPHIAKLVTEAARQHIEVLHAYGTPFDQDDEGAFVMSKEAAHSWPRVVRVKGDQAGKAIMAALIEQVLDTPSITMLEGWSAVELLTGKEAMNGILACDPDGQSQVLTANAYLMAAGGTGSLYARTTNPPNIRGLALGMAAKAGAVIADAEFVQFHPTAIALDRDPAPLATEALRGDGATLIDRHGNRFMQSVHPDAELAPRDIVAREIFAQYQAGTRPALDTRSAIGRHITSGFPTVYRYCIEAGIDPLTNVIPVVPAAHYHMGGLSTDATGQTTIAGLWVAGEAASTGLHGANRLASNGLLEALVFAQICTKGMKAHLATNPPRKPAPKVPDCACAPPPRTAVATLRQTMSENVGVLRSGETLKHALQVFRQLAIENKGISTDFDNMLAAATLITAAALKREESRGGHFRTDFPQKDVAFAERSFMTLAEAEEIRDAT